MKQKTRKPTDREVLEKIASLGHGLRDEVRDWANIGRHAVMEAREQLAGKCKCCGRPKEWKPKEPK